MYEISFCSNNAGFEVMEKALLHDRTSNMSSSKVDAVPIKVHGTFLFLYF